MTGIIRELRLSREFAGNNLVISQSQNSHIPTIREKNSKYKLNIYSGVLYKL